GLAAIRRLDQLADGSRAADTILKVMGKEFRAEPPHMTTCLPGWRGRFAPHLPPLLRARSANPDMACQSHELVSAGEPVVERAESIRVVAIEAFALDPLEHVSEIDITGTRLQMNFVAVTKTIGEAHLFDPASHATVVGPLSAAWSRPKQVI